MPAQPLLGSEVLLAYLKTEQGSRLLPHIPPSWAGHLLHRGRDTGVGEAREGVHQVDARRDTKAVDEATVVERQRRQLDALALHLADRGGARDLLQGWTVEIKARDGGANTYAIFVSPGCRRFRSRREVARFFDIGEDGRAPMARAAGRLQPGKQPR